MREKAIILTLPTEEVSMHFLSDIHMDAPDHDRDALTADLEEVKARDGLIFIGGDIWSEIFWNDLKRYDASHTHIMDNVIDHHVNDAYELFKPYADRIVMMSVGNHEAAVIQHHHTDPTLRLIEKLNAVRENPKVPESIKHGGYTGFLIVRFKDTTHSASEKIYYHHGKGGGAVVTRGMIDVNRVMVGNRADVYWLQHKHTNPTDIPKVREVLDTGSVKTKKVLVFYTAGYKGKIVTHDYDTIGYQKDWGEENFYIPESSGNAILTYHRFGYAKDGHIVYKRSIEKGA